MVLVCKDQHIFQRDNTVKKTVAYCLSLEHAHTTFPSAASTSVIKLFHCKEDNEYARGIIKL